MFKYALLWLSLLVIAFVNAGIRELTYGPHLGGRIAIQVSVFTGILLFGAAIFVIATKWPFGSARRAIYVGVLWVVMTEVFEFSMVCLYMKRPFSFFVDMHNVLKAEFWPIILLWLMVAPLIFQSARAGKNHKLS